MNAHSPAVFCQLLTIARSANYFIRDTFNKLSSPYRIMTFLFVFPSSYFTKLARTRRKKEVIEIRKKGTLLWAGSPKWRIYYDSLWGQ